MPYCPKCGERVNEGDEFCNKCGARLGRELGDLERTERAAVKTPETKDIATQVVSAKIPKAKEEGEEIQRQLKTGVAIKTGFLPLGFILFFCTPTIVVDGRAYRKRWGTHFFELEPGRHTIKIFFHYLFMAECGANSIDVIVEEGKTSRVKYFMPPWIFAKGSIKEVPERLITKQPAVAGILSILAGVIELIIGFTLSLSEGNPFGWFAAVAGIIALVSGVYAIRREVWKLALAGAICSLGAFPLGIAAIILVVRSRSEFE